MLNEQNILKKFNFKLIIKTLPLATIFILLIILIYVSFFLYKNFYQTITHAQKIELLRNQVSVIKVDIDLYEKIVKNLEKRKNINFTGLSDLKNPFQISDEKSNELGINP